MLGIRERCLDCTYLGEHRLMLDSARELVGHHRLGLELELIPSRLQLLLDQSTRFA
jgi:hypothetical protein